MKLALHDLLNAHPVLRGHPIDYPLSGGLALSRAGHSSPARAETEHDGVADSASLEWHIDDATSLEAMDAHRLTEDGAEAVALAYVHQVGRWQIKRRLRRGERADWLLQSEARWLALEISGTVQEDARHRLKEKNDQVSRCTLPAARMAVVVAFRRPTILAESV